MVLLAKQDKIRKYIQRYNLVLARVGQGTRKSAQDGGRSIAQTKKISQIFLKRNACYFVLKSDS